MKPQRDEKRRKTTLRQKRLSTHDIIQSYADKLYKKMGAGIPISEIPISNPKELQKLIIHILKKTSSRTQNDILIIRYYLTHFPGFINALNISENFHDPQEIMQKISTFIQCEYMKKNTIVCLNGQLGDKFYLIFNGLIGVLVPNSYTMIMTPNEFIGHLLTLFELHELDLIHKTISSNRKILDSTYTKQIIDLEKQTQTIKQLTCFKSEEIELNEYINRLIPKEVTSNSKESMEFTLWKYIKVVDLESGKSFGDVALKDNFSKRTATIITLEDSYFGIIKKDIYQACIRDTLERIRRNNIETIYNTKLFYDYSKELFKIYIFNNFKGVVINRGKYLFYQGEERKEIYFIKSGEFKVDVFCSCKDLSEIIDNFGGDSYNRDLLIKIQLNEKMKSYNKEKRIFSIFLVKKGDVLGMDDYLFFNTNNFFCSVRCISKTAEYFSITLNYFNKLKEDFLIRKNYEKWIKVRKKLIIERLIELKNNTLYHYYSLVNETNHIENKEEEKSISKNNVKTNSTFYNEENILKEKIINTKTSFNSFRKFFFPNQKNKKVILNNSESKGKVKLNNSSSTNLNLNNINKSDNKKLFTNSIEPINKFNISEYQNKNNINKNNYKPNLTFGNFNVGKKVMPRLKIYNNIINKLISEKDAICSNLKQKLHNFDILAMDKFIENTETGKNIQKNPLYTKYFTNYYDYINSDLFNKKPINLRYKSRKKVVLLDS